MTKALLIPYSLRSNPTPQTNENNAHSQAQNDETAHGHITGHTADDLPKLITLSTLRSTPSYRTDDDSEYRKIGGQL